MPVLTDYLVDHVYPVVPHNSGASPEVVARVRGPGHRYAADLAHGRQPRCSRLPPARRSGPPASAMRPDGGSRFCRNWVPIRRRDGLRMPMTTRSISPRTTNYFVCRFPNGAVALAPHLRDLQEDWPGGFLRNPEEDKAVVAQVKTPVGSDLTEELQSQWPHSHLRGTARRCVSFRRRRDTGGLLAAAGAIESALTAGPTTFADQPMALIAWAPVDAARRVDGGAVMQILAHGSGDVHIPVGNPTGPMDLIQEGATPRQSRKRYPPAAWKTAF